MGKQPVILVAPHGADDNNTIALTKQAAEKLDCYAVINQGFERASYVDVNNDLADCNRVDHAKEPVVFDEYLKPIVKFQTALWRKMYPGVAPPSYIPVAAKGKPMVLYIHGAGNKVHAAVGEQVGIIIGYGLGSKKDSLTCEPWAKNLFVDLYRQYGTNGECYEGQGGGKYAGRSSNNMNQYFRKHLNTRAVNCMQLEFPWSTRNTASEISLTATLLAVVLEEHLKQTSYDPVPVAKFI
jgi:hypothetical protein